MTALPFPGPRQLEAILRLLELLADGRFHSGEDLGAALGVGRGGVWRLMRSLAALGFEVHGVTGKGYRLAESVDLLAEERIRAAMGPHDGPALRQLDVLPSVDSTNRWLIGRAVSGGTAPAAVVSEHQSGGRGRRGRVWVSPFGQNLYLSLLWYFEDIAHALPACSLAVAVAVARALRSMGAGDIGLKWPNDVYWRGRKLAGMLLELVGEAAGPYKVVIGVGVNVNMMAADIDQPWTSLRMVTGQPWDRNRVAGRLLEEMLAGVARFERQGMAACQADWDALDLTRGRRVTLHLADGRVEGTALGTDGDGALRIRTGQGVRHFHAGEVSLRVAP
ncbi:MAG: biotin--[acetyl-CoA-carboxylase] ligase [Gammaproteobacteria bacterium]|nr:biotin--[acetyl-CoA-carboxylase] ligase [Gammaproteobacteria bacterium]